MVSKRFRLLLLLLFPAVVAAQEIRLSNRFVVDVAVDGQDCIWAATEDGLNCYDGISTRIFEKGPGGLPTNQLNSILVDREEPLVWIAMQKAGLAAYDIRTGQFSVYRTDQSPESLPDDDVTHVEQAPDGAVWVSTYSKGMARLDRANGRFTQYNPANFTGMRDLPLHTFIFRGDQLVLGYWADGLSILSLTDRSYLDLRHDPADPSSLPSDEVRSLLVDSHNRLWVGTTEGLALFSDAGRTFTIFRHRAGDAHSLPEGAVFDLVEDRDGRLLVASSTGAVMSLDISQDGTVPADSPFTVLTPPDQDARPQVRSLAVDRFGNLWLGTYGSGIGFISGRRPGAGSVSLRGGESAEALSLAFSPSGALVVGSRAGRVEVLSEARESLLAGSGGELGTVMSLAADGAGRWWIGTEENGLYLVDGGRRRRVALSRAALNIRTLLPDDGRLWAGSEQGLFCIDRSTLRQTGHWIRRDGSLPDDLIRKLLKDAAGRLWVGTYGHGLAVYDAGLHRLVTYDLMHGILSDTVNDLLEDSEGRVWVATPAGLARFDHGPGEHPVLFTARSGLPAENIRALAEDARGNLWMSCNDGAACMKPDGTTLFFDHRDGLPDGNYFSGAVARSGQGRIWFGSTAGAAWIDPEVLLADETLPPVAFLTQEDALSTSYRNNYLRVRFRVPDHALAPRVEYSYRIPDLDPAWYECGQELEFHQLPYGKHTLQVRARLHSYDWSDEPESVVLSLRPPFWRTWWALGFYILLGLALLFLAIRSQAHKLVMRNKEKLQQDRLLQERQAGEERMVFYTNVTHELRTPLTLILGPLADLSEDKEIPAPVRSRIGKVKQSAQQLLGLVNQLLEFRKTETDNRRLTVEYGDLSEFVESVGRQFRDLSIDKAVSIVLSVEPGIHQLYDPEALTIILNNLLSNARKFTPSGRIVLSLQQEDDGVILRVTDTGIGIPAEDLDHIFDRYYRGDGSGQTIGTGIGMALVKNLFDLHHIDLSINSTPGRGSEFRLKLDPAEDYPEAVHSPRTVREEPAQEYEPVPEGGKYRILVVEDNPEIREYIQESLASEYAVLTAGHGRDGLKTAIREIPDIIVSDIMMPVMDGITFTKAIRQDVRTSHIPVILLTAKGSDESRVEGYDVGADSYLVKPFRKALLLSRIRNLLDKRTHLMRQVSETGEAADLSPVDSEFLTRYTQFVEEHLSEEKINIASLAGEFAMSQSTLYRKVKAVSGLSPNELIRNIRLNKAAVMLRKTDSSVSEIAWQTGFGSTVYFRTCFKERYGQTPSEYRNEPGE